MILEFTWLCEHNPEIDWTKSKVKMSCCPCHCIICAAEAYKKQRAKVLQVKKKYKSIAMKTKPVASHVSKDFQIEHQIIGNPLVIIPPLNPNLPPFVLKLVKDHDTGFLTSDKIKVLVDMVAKQEKAFAWEDSERGSLHPDFFPPVCIPTIPHVPWVQHNHPILPGLEKEVCKIICNKISAGIYEPLNSAYCLQWFCVLKKNGKLRIVHSLEPLNCVTIQVPPFPDHIAESFTGCICGATLMLWEFFELLNRILQQMKYCGGTFSSHKLILCTPTFKILGHLCTPLVPIDYESPDPVILAVDTSYIAVRYYLCQCTNDNHKERRYKKAIASDAHILLVKKWLHDLARPNGLSNNEYATFICYTSMFFEQLTLQCRQEDLDHLHSNMLSAHCLAAIRFKAEHAATICDYNFKTGNLVLMRNTRIEVMHNKKIKPRYLGPLVVISCNCRGTYILCELDGSVLHCPIAAFHLIPYFAREHITVPSDTFDINTLQLRELEQTDLVDNDDTGNATSEEETKNLPFAKP
ncbi:hypothetical protein J132_10859 [Termitomyces sp. J132]|nr:hypothetical protein J132_10859 [Termitomyces sp. J132]